MVAAGATEPTLGPRIAPLRAALRALAAVAAFASPMGARADGTVTLRGAYYKERATRVSQPMIDADLAVGDDGRLQAHALVDSITSASVAAGAGDEPFNERRTEAGGSYLHSMGGLRVGGGARVSVEPDYRSMLASGRGELDLAQRNATLGVTLAYAHDAISNAGSQSGLSSAFRDSLDTFLVSTSATQILSKTLLAGLTYDLSYLNGYQANPYRIVAVGGALESENVPETRVRHALFASLRAFLPPSRTTAVAGYRLYRDSWGIIGHTPELRLVQEVARGLDLYLRYRFHWQSAAKFYQQIYDADDRGGFVTADDKLSRHRVDIYGVKAGAALELFGVDNSWREGRVELLIDYIRQTTHFGDAVSAQLAFIVPLEY